MTKKIIFLGDTLLNNEPLGIQRFAHEIILELNSMYRDYEIELVIPKDVPCKLNLKNIKIVRYGQYKSPFLWRQWFFPKYVRSQKGIGVDFTLGLSVLNHDIVGIFDCIYEKFPQDFRSKKEKMRRLSYMLRARYVIKHAKQIVSISDYSKSDILKCYKIPEKKVKIVACGWQHYKRIASNTDILNKFELLEKHFIFALGSSLPHKNFEWILRAARCNPKYTFVITGTNRLSNYQTKLKKYDFKNLIFTGFLKDNEVKALMQNCAVFVHPSMYEGFGIPPLEALSSGAKVAVADSTCLPEIFGKSVCYFDPTESNPNIETILNKLERVLPEDKEYVLAKYNWHKSAEQIHEIFNIYANG